MTGGVELVVIGANGGPERSYGGSALAAGGAGLLAQALPGALFDTGPHGCRTTVVPPDADANTMLTALRDAARQAGAVAGGLPARPAGGRPARAAAGAGHRRQHPGQRLSARPGLGLGGRAPWCTAPRTRCCCWSTRWRRRRPGRRSAGWTARRAWPSCWHTPGCRYGAGSGRTRAAGAAAGAVLPGGEGSFSWALGRVLERGVPGAPATIGPAELQPAVAAELAWGELASGIEARVLVPPSGGRLLMRNRAAVRGALAGLSVSEELLAVLWRESAPTDPPSA